MPIDYRQAGRTRDPGQVPTLTIPASLTNMPAPKDMAIERLKFDLDPVITLKGVTRSLGMEATKEQDFQRFVKDNLNAPNEAKFRQALYQKLYNDMRETDPTLRQALAQRAMSYYKGAGKSAQEAIQATRGANVRKPMTKLEKAEGDRGGHVIGHTSSGKPVYASQHENAVADTAKRKSDVARIHEVSSKLYPDFSAQDHKDAEDMHATTRYSQAPEHELSHRSSMRHERLRLAAEAKARASSGAAKPSRPPPTPDALALQAAHRATRASLLAYEADSAGVLPHADIQKLHAKAAKLHRASATLSGRLDGISPNVIHHHQQADRHEAKARAAPSSTPPTVTKSKGTPMQKSESTGISSDFGGNPGSTDARVVIPAKAKAADDDSQEGEAEDMAKGLEAGDTPEPQEQDISEGAGNAEPDETISLADDAALEASDKMLKKSTGLHGWLSKAFGEPDDDSDEDADESDEDSDDEIGDEDMSDDENMEKAEGEGTRGGHIIGHTGSGKPIYASGSKTSSYTPADHKDASVAHHDAVTALDKKVDMHTISGRASPDGVARARHYDLMGKHTSAMARPSAPKKSSAKQSKAAANNAIAARSHTSRDAAYAASGDAATDAQHRKAASLHREAARAALDRGNMDVHSEMARHHDTVTNPAASAKERTKAFSGIWGRTGEHQDFQAAAKEHAAKESGMTKSKGTPMAKSLHQWLQKSGAIPGADDDCCDGPDAKELQEGEPSEAQILNNKANGIGQALDGLTGKQPKEANGQAFPGSDNPTGGDQQLSEDDPTAAGKMDEDMGLVEHSPEVSGASNMQVGKLDQAAMGGSDKGPGGQGGGADDMQSDRINKSTGVLPTRQEATYGNRMAAIARNQGQRDVIAGVGKAPPKSKPQPMQKSQGFDPEASDKAIDQMMKSSDGFYQQGSPTLHAHQTLLKSNPCRACGDTMPVWTSRCPSCGVDELNKSEAHTNVVVQRPGMRPSVTPDLYLPGGVKRK